MSLKRRSKHAESLTLTDILSITSATGTYNPTNSVIPKIRKAAYDTRFAINHHINGSKFEKIYATSDLHADYRNFINYLIKIGIIFAPQNIDLFDNAQIYDPRLLLNFGWIPENTLLVILGDLVDGKRAFSPTVAGSVLDPQGSFELLLHMFIYQLRIKALENNSDVLFLIGNHDINTVLNTENDYMYENYVSDEAKRFFTTKELRASCLTNFYLLSPYLFLTIGKDDGSEIYMVHGGFHNIKYNPFAGEEFDANMKILTEEWKKYGLDEKEIEGFLIAAENNVDDFELMMKDDDFDYTLKDVRFKHQPMSFLEALEAQQQTINRVILEENSFDNTIADPELRANVNNNSPLWSRYYMEGLGSFNESYVCENIMSEPAFLNKTIIVGHCQTENSEFKYKKTVDGSNTKGGQYQQCVDPQDNTGCVVTACDNDEETKIIFVDTGLSSAFRVGTTLDNEKLRNSEIIVLKHVEGEDAYGRFYNEIKRVRTNGEEYIVYPKSKQTGWKKTTGGGKRTRRFKGTKLKRKTNKRRM